MKQKLRILNKKFRASFWQMPFFLKFLTIVGCFGVLFIIAPFIPFADFEIEGNQVNIAEFWSSGVAIGFLLTGIFLLIFARKTINKDPRARQFLVFAWLSACFNPYAVSMGYLLDLGYLINSLIPLGFWVWYLFMKKSVQVFYGSNQKYSHSFNKELLADSVPSLQSPGVRQSKSAKRHIL